MNDNTFKTIVLQGGARFSNKYSIEVVMTQERKINQDGNIKVTNTIVHKVKASIENNERIEYE